jgi:hypothetical protein
MSRLRPQVFEPFHPSEIKPYPLQKEQRKTIATALGLSRLPRLMATLLELEIGTYKKLSSRREITPGQVIAAIDKAQEVGLEFEKALRAFTDIACSGVDATTYFALTEFASSCRGSVFTFFAKAENQKKRLNGNPPPRIKNQPLQGLCDRLRVLFEAVQEVRQKEPSRKELVDFVLAILEAADIPCVDYRLHPARLERFFRAGAKGSSLKSLGSELRQEIKEAVG